MRMALRGPGEAIGPKTFQPAGTWKKPTPADFDKFMASQGRRGETVKNLAYEVAGYPTPASVAAWVTAAQYFNPREA